MTARRAAANPTSVTAIAGTVRRNSTPAVAPSAKANAAYPIGATPWKPKFARPKRFWFAASIGLAHQSTIQVSSPPIAMAAMPTSPSFTASQRCRVTLWVQARRKVPVSSSRAMSGAPKKSPTSAGAMVTMNGSA